MRFLILSLLLISSASAAQEAPADSTLGALVDAPVKCEAPEPREGGTFYGRVTEAETDEPLVGANVFLPEIQRGAAADMEGCFAIPGLPDGEFSVRFTFVGFEEVIATLTVQRANAIRVDAVLEPASCGGIVFCDCFGNPLVPREAYTLRRIVYANWNRDPCACDCGTHERGALPDGR